MPQLVIDYRLDTKQPGYAFSSHTNGVSEAIRKAVWRHAIPRGTGWADFPGMRSIKCFPVSDALAAVSTITVTDQEDEQGRRGIRRAEIDLIPLPEILNHVQGLLNAMPVSVQHASSQLFHAGVWARILDRALPKVGRKQPQVVFVYPSHGVDSWQIVEAAVLRLAASWPLHAMPGWGKFFSFTTLALTAESESRVVAIPARKVAQADYRHVVHLPVL